MTCLCLTRNRLGWLPKAIAYYQSQTYPRRELLILSDGADVRGVIPDDPTIRHLHLAEAPEIGDKRNFGCELARGSIIAHWDDDDYSAPERLADQVRRLLQSGAAVTGYHTMRFTDGAAWWEFSGTPDYAVGTSLCYRREWWRINRFPSLQVQEDYAMVVAARAHGGIASVDAGDLMYATIHPQNTSPRQLAGPSWRKL